MDLSHNTVSPAVAEKLTAIENQFILMRSAGISVREISQKLNKSTHTICKWNKKFAKEILRARNNEFSELQKKIIDSKTARLNLLKNEFDRASVLLKKQKIDVGDTYGTYNNFLELFIKLSDLMSSCESDILSVGVRYKDNIEPEENPPDIEQENREIATSLPVSNSVAQIDENQITDNNKVNPLEQQSATKCNIATSRKYELYKKHNNTT